MSSDFFSRVELPAEDERQVRSRTRVVLSQRDPWGHPHPRQDLRPDRTGASTYSGCHVVASDGIVKRDTGTGLLRMGTGTPSLSVVGGICGSPIDARRQGVEGSDEHGDGH